MSDWINADIRTITPDLLVSIDYAKLNITQTNNQLSVLQTAFILVGLTNQTDHVMRTTYPHALVRGTQTLASVYIEARRMYWSSRIAIGVYPVS